MNDTQNGQKNTDSSTLLAQPSQRRGYNPPPAYKSIESADPFKERMVELEKKPTDPDEIQIGGNHYKELKLQPTEYVLANGLGFIEGNVVKYVTRHASKGGADDIRK